MTSNTRSNRADPHGTAAAWAALRAGTVQALLEVATDPGSSAEALATIVPPARELASLPTVVALAVLAHPQCPDGLAARLTGHPAPAVRLAVVRYPGQLTSMAEDRLLGDPDPVVRGAAARRWGRLDGR